MRRLPPRHRQLWLDKTCIFVALTLFALFTQACGPAEEHPRSPTSQPSKDPEVQPLSYSSILTALEQLEASAKSKSASDVATDITNLSTRISISFPIALDEPFQFHTFHDRLIKTTTAIVTKNDPAITQGFDDVLNDLSAKTFTGKAYRFPIDVAVARLMLAQQTPKLTTALRVDFTGFSKDEFAVRQSITVESFWQNAFLYSSNSGVTKEEDTGAVLAAHDGKLVAILEFKNDRAAIRPLDFSKQQDLAGTVALMPGYVSSVGRRAAYARLGIGEKLFQEFFKYARAAGITHSYLHVRHNNEAALNLYKKLGYTEVGAVANYYSSPPANALVMQKRL